MGKIFNNLLLWGAAASIQRSVREPRPIVEWDGFRPVEIPRSYRCNAPNGIGGDECFVSYYSYWEVRVKNHRKYLHFSRGGDVETGKGVILTCLDMPNLTEEEQEVAKTIEAEIYFFRFKNTYNIELTHCGDGPTPYIRVLLERIDLIKDIAFDHLRRYHLDPAVRQARI